MIKCNFCKIKYSDAGTTYYAKCNKCGKVLEACINCSDALIVICNECINTRRINMTKKIIVDSCEHCPLRGYQHFLGDGWKHICTHAHTDGMEIPDTSIIHPDCPLEENKRSCTCHD